MIGILKLDINRLRRPVALAIHGILISLLLSGCQKKSESKTENETIVTAKPQIKITPLYYKGTLGPINSETVLSPLEGRVTSIDFQYGQFIKKGQNLISLDASRLSENYRKTVSEFLQKKQTYENGLVSFQGTEALYKAGVISKEEYSTAASTERSNALAYFQARYELEQLLPQANLSVKSIEQLNLSDMTKVNDILYKQFQEMKVLAPTQGIALFPTAEQKKGSSGDGRVRVGDDLKNGQYIMSIGDLSGYSMKINVNEININLIKPNLPAKITGDAFPGIQLAGYISSVSSQANPETGESLSTFETIIKIPNVDPKLQSIIRIGMSAQVELDIPSKSQIYLPIKAVYEKNGQKMVTIINKAGQRQEVQVITGETTITDVAIIEGITPGEKVVVPH